MNKLVKKVKEVLSKKFITAEGTKVSIYRPCFIVGVDECSATHGDGPNANNFMKLVTRDYKKADAKYNQLAKNDERWSYGYTIAYLMVTNEDGKFYVLKGGENNK